MTVGEKIRKTRKQKKMTQNTLAGLTGLAAITIRQYEADKYTPKIENLSKIAHALETSLSEFLKPGLNNGNFQLNEEQRRILLFFDALNANGKKEALKRIEELSFIPAYSLNENN
ncbi:MAG: helix-turn-helix domain-containing protein [Lachnospiraceae bacterium]